MKSSLVIYDVVGTVIRVTNGNPQDPVGIPFMYVEVPKGKYIEKIDVSGEEHTPVFLDLKKNEIQILQEKVDELTIMLGDALLEGGI